MKKNLKCEAISAIAKVVGVYRFAHNYDSRLSVFCLFWFYRLVGLAVTHGLWSGKSKFQFLGRSNR